MPLAPAFVAVTSPTPAIVAGASMPVKIGNGKSSTVVTFDICSGWFAVLVFVAGVNLYILSSLSPLAVTAATIRLLLR